MTTTKHGTYTLWARTVGDPRPKGGTYPPGSWQLIAGGLEYQDGADRELTSNARAEEHDTHMEYKLLPSSVAP